ncbi:MULTISPECIES: 50S ribosomal protein L33 [Anoxybacillus]|uniref:Large ribosomal subunit protein bL33 n=1 Tax=Anoxybacteroides rupiense TaxID=311460 RepID=A0ABD5J165_9BACL|nr:MULTISPECIES: 50S ribosomal protein L33 [Anoxybacillus]MBS2772449.1 50S ribosomal protein L33 [Anoxybacillus rupiensis]MDE8565131.1 50S ribosomal protein L33 [Anoxybacillus rupiensis]MED5053316.1 50S ribosomal protein L33 [Anoxybacillus rupiensis]OQM45304.1 50S ribosomal protein L33 [Anoxybacillus sp. UARK-01]QHC02665.1 50S ribosomal protein L33 [Anoxybacillus sp. PDR2]
MRKKVILACSQCNTRNYSTMKNTANTQERLDIKKFCKTCNEHTIHRETK